MTTLNEVVTDLRAECAALDKVLASLSAEDWSRETPAVGWDTRDTVGHLADTDDLMYDSATGGERNLMAEAQAASGGVLPANSKSTVDDFTAWQIKKVRKMQWPEVYAWWRSATARLHETLDSLDPNRRYPWGPNQVSPLSLASARLMETWAHSLDIHAAAGVDYTDTDRIRHIAYLGHRAIPYAFMLAGQEEPPGPVRLELTAPSRETWTIGGDDAPNVIRGSASDWCRVVARRDRDGAAQRLQGEGPDAAKVIEHGRAFL